VVNHTNNFTTLVGISYGFVWYPIEISIMLTLIEYLHTIDVYYYWIAFYHPSMQHQVKRRSSLMGRIPQYHTCWSAMQFFMEKNWKSCVEPIDFQVFTIPCCCFTSCSLRCHLSFSMSRSGSIAVAFPLASTFMVVATRYQRCMSWRREHFQCYLKWFKNKENFHRLHSSRFM